MAEDKLNRSQVETLGGSAEFIFSAAASRLRTHQAASKASAVLGGSHNKARVSL